MFRAGWWSRAVTSKLNAAFDLFAVALAVVLSTRLSQERVGAFTIGFLVVAGLLWAVGTFLLRYYDPWARRDRIEEAAELALLAFGLATALAAGRFAGPELDGLPTPGALFLILWPLVLAARLLVFQRLNRMARLDEGEVLIVGSGALARCTAEALGAQERRRRRTVRGLLRLPEDVPFQSHSEWPVLGQSEELEALLRTCAVSEVYLASNENRHATAMQEAIRTCERLGMPFALPACHYRLERARPSDPASDDGYVHFVTQSDKPYQHAAKRLFDLGASTVALVLLWPLFVLAAALIKLTSRGPVFFRQERVGLHGRPFHMIKFRTMVPNADALKEQLAAKNEVSGPVFKIADDPRVTPLGRFLRRHSIDELPQFINVLRGDMSIVGPRPPVPGEVAHYDPWQLRRLSVRPGLTCIWQVSGRNQISFEEWMYLDMRYIDHWSFAGDLNLILRTVPVVLNGRGAS